MINNKYIVITIIAILFCACIGAQPEKTKMFRLGFDIAHTQVRDDILLPLKWTGPTPSIVLGFCKQNQSNWHGVNGGISLAMLNDRYGYKGMILSVGAKYHYLHSIAPDLLKGNLFLGANLGWSINDGFYFEWDDEHLYWLTAIGIGPSIGWIKNFHQNQKIQALVSFPAAALISRPEEFQFVKIEPLDHIGYWFSGPHQDLRFATLDKYQSGQISLAYMRHRYTIVYTGAFAHTNIPQPVSLITHSIGTTWDFHF